MPFVLVLAFGSLLLQVASAGAVPHHAPHPPRPRVQNNTDLVWNGQLGPGTYSIDGFIPDVNNPSDALNGYPADDPTSGFTPSQEYFAGLIHGEPTDGSPEVRLYCIDIRTDTLSGFGYYLGTWGAAAVPNVGYVARLLNEYYPNTAKPAGLTDDQKAAAVQAAIWFFSDGFVLNTSTGSLRDAAARIVDHILSQGALPAPSPPTLTITPSQASGGSGSAVGPFRVRTDAPDATVLATGGSMFSDRAGTAPLPNPITVTSGTRIWLRSSGTDNAVLQATSKATVPTGNVYLYDGNTAGYTTGQKLILAITATLTTTVQATADFHPSGSLVVSKTIAGPAAGSQGQVVIHVTCDDGVRRGDLIIPAGTPAGTKSRRYRHIAAGTKCTIIETSNGSVVGTDVVVTGDGQEVTILADESKTVDITDTYSAVPSPGPGPGPGPSSLLVTKTIAGPLAGHQGPVTIHVVCNGTAQSPDFIIAARTPAGSYSQSFGPVAAGSVCTVTETADGATDTVAAIVSGNDENVTVPAGEVLPVNVMNVYEQGPSPLPDVVAGSLKVTKIIAGPSAGRQGRIDILVACRRVAHLRLPHPRSRPLGFCVTLLPRPPARVPLYRHRDCERSHQHGGGGYDSWA